VPSQADILVMCQTRAMRTVENGIVDSPLDVQQDLVLTGVANAGGVVRDGATLDLSGVWHGELRVDAGGRVEMTGVFNGVLKNAGLVVVSGRFNGDVISNDGELLDRVGSIGHRGGRPLVLAADGSLAPTSANSTYTITPNTPLCRYVDGAFEPVR
jgi:hypothetical protein